MNCEITATQSASGIGNGTLMISKTIPCATAEMIARIVREKTYPPVFSIARSQMFINISWRLGASSEPILSRSFGPSATR